VLQSAGTCTCSSSVDTVDAGRTCISSTTKILMTSCSHKKNNNKNAAAESLKHWYCLKYDAILQLNSFSLVIMIVNYTIKITITCNCSSKNTITTTITWMN